MDFYTNEFIAGINEMLALQKQGNNIFEIKGGSLFPNVERQAMWQFSRGPKHLHLHDGQQTYSFAGELGDEDTDVEKTPDVPLPDMFKDSATKGKVQVHRADPGSIYFTLQEGTRNPTYTLRHTGESKWRAIPKKRKAKEQLAAPAAIPNVNVEAIKEGMAKELELFVKAGEGGALDFFNHAASSALTGGINGGVRTIMSPGLIGGNPYNLNDNPLVNAGKAGLLGAGLGAGYHALKRKFINTPEENKQETLPSTLRQIALPGLALAGLNMGQRSMFPDYYQAAARHQTPDFVEPSR